jgi:hypothetical protein
MGLHAASHKAACIVNAATPREVEMSESTEPARQPNPAAARALAEAAARRREIDDRTALAPKEQGGRGGLDPVRYGDWEIKGLASDF